MRPTHRGGHNSNDRTHTYLVEEEVLDSVSTTWLLKVKASAKPARGTLAEPSTSNTTNVPAKDPMADERCG